MNNRNVIKRKNEDLYEPLEQLEARFLESGKDLQKSWASLTEAELRFVVGEINRCLCNPRYFLENYHFIRTKGAVVQPLWPFWDAQEMFLSSFQKQFDRGEPIRIITLKARQLGITTVSVALMCWLTFLHPNVHALSMSDEEDRVDVNFSMARTSWANLPWWLQPEKRYDVRGQLLGFDRVKDVDRARDPGMQSLLYFESANQASGAAYSKSLYGAHLAEVARYRNSNSITEGIFGSLVNYKHSIGIMESTARGRHSAWHRICRASERGTLKWDFVFMEWFREPGYSVSVPDGFERTQEEQAIAKKCKEELSHEMTDGQLAWRRSKLAEFEATDGSGDKFGQEFPLCVCRETLVSTELGILKIEDISSAKFTESGKIIGYGPQPPSEIYILTTKMGRILRGTGDHPIARIDGGFTRLSDLAVGDEIMLRPPMFAQNIYEHKWRPIAGCESKIVVDEMWAYFMGFFMGDGCWYNGCLSIACDGKDEDVANFASKTVEYILGSVPIRRIISKVQGRKGCIELRLGCARATESLSKMGLIHRINQNRWSRTVSVPESILRSPVNIITAFLRSLFECDGSASGRRLRFGSCKIGFVREVQLLLLGFGINSTIKSSIKIAGNGNSYNFYALNFGLVASRIFHSKIGFISKRKNDALTELVREKGKNGNRAAGHPPKENILHDFVSEVTIGGYESTYDLTVEGGHAFSANGILTHNTPAEAFISSGRCAFSKKRLNDMLIHFCRPPKWRGEISLDEKNNLTPRMSPQYEGRLQIWEFPNTKEKYYIGADPSMGIETGDPACAQVYLIPEDINRPLRQVARWHGWSAPTQFARILAAIGYLYNTAEIAPECNVVMTVASDLVKVLNYPSWYRWQREDKVRSSYSNWIGWVTSFRNKNELIARFREALDEWTVIIRCTDDVDEMFDFVEEEEGSQRYSARVGSTDDSVMANMITYYCATMLRPRKSGDIDEKPAPTGIDFQNSEYSPIYDKDSPEYGQDKDLTRYDEL